jgi:hypothetical protein
MVIRKPNNYWNYENCYKEALKYKSRGEFSKGCHTAYSNALTNRWIDDYTWFSESASKKKWNYETCFEEAKKYTTKSEFHDGSNGAYQIACRNKWLKDYTWFEDGNQKRIKWTRESCYQEASKYKSRGEFVKGNQSAYSKASQNGWLDDYTWLSCRKEHTYEEVYEVAKKYEYKVDFMKNNRREYDAARSHGWLKEFDWFLDGIKRTGERHRKWNYETCYQEALKYKTRGTFGTKSSRAYLIAIQNGWLDDYFWLEDKRINQEKDEIDCVYAYEFTDFNAVYVGRTLTIRKKDRDREHLYMNNDAVARFAKKHNIAVPKPKYLEDSITIKEGVEKECYWIAKYKELGWHVLNRAKGGSIGSLGSGKWTHDSCYAEAKKFKTIRDFILQSPHAYRKAYKRNWVGEYVWLEDNIKHSLDYYTYEKCFEIAKKYQSQLEFRRKQNGAFRSAQKNNWLDDYVWHKRAFRWTEKTLLEEAKKYKTRSDFARGMPGAYEYALKYSLLDKCVWFDETKKPNGYWKYDTCFQEARKYKTQADYRKNSLGAYKVSARNNWIKDYTWFEVPTSKWTYEVCKAEASKYDCRRGLYKGCRGAYRKSLEQGWLDEFYPVRVHRILDYDTCKELASKYKNTKELLANERNLYEKLRTSGWLDDFFPKPISKVMD